MLLTSKTFVVAVDGSRLGFRAVRLAAWLCDFRTRDKVRCVSIAKGMTAMEALGLVNAAESLLRESGVPATSIVPGAVLTISEGSSLADTLAKAAMGGHLVMGAGGARLQKEAENRKTTASAAIGSVAAQCMTICHAPVILAKPKGIAKLDTPQFLTERRAGTGMVVAVAVDSSRISQKCFDMTLRLVQRGDIVKIVHVTNSDENVLRPGAVNTLLGNSAIRQYYQQECSKACAIKLGCHFEFEETPVGKHGVAQALLDYLEVVLADLVIMGSIELTHVKPGSDALGSVAATIAKKTPAHVLIAKHFAHV